MEPTISGLIASAESGDDAAAQALFATLYAELHRLASRQLARNAGVTLGTTSLLHAAYVDIAGREGVAFPDRARFMAYAARVMRGVIVDYARRRRAKKRGGQFEITSLGQEVAGAEAAEAAELEHMGQALDELAEAEPLLAQVVDLHFFCGFSFAEIAALRAVSERTVQRHWEKARIYLHRWMKDA